MSRDNARTPMQWDDSPPAGFTTGEPWIPVNPNHTEINAREAVADPGSVFHHYRRLIELRHEEPAVAHGDFTMLLADDPQVYAYTRRLGDTELLVVANVSGEPASAEGIPDAGRWADAELLITNLQERGQAPLLRLEPWEARAYRLRA
jgi:oligo-1,6-glucosidase